MLVMKIALGVFIGGVALILASALAFQVITSNARINASAAEYEASHPR